MPAASLFMEFGFPQLIQQAADENLGLGIFIRSLVGMDREAVSQAFNGLIAATKPRRIKLSSSS